MFYQQLIENLENIFKQLKLRFIEFFPYFIGALIVFGIGILLAFIIKSISFKLIKNIKVFLPAKSLQIKLNQLKIDRAASFISESLFWVILLLALTAATETIGLHIVTVWLSGIASYFPKIIAAILLAFAGIIGSSVCRDFLVNSASRANVSYGHLLGEIARYSILLITALIVIEQIGINLTFITNISMIVLALLLFGASLAFGLGAKTSVNNILASYYLNKIYKVGNIVRINDIEGRITKIMPNFVILDTVEGQVAVPAGEFSQKSSILIRRD